VQLIYGLANRSAAVRVPASANAPETKRIEFRPPDATCNIYLALSAMLLAGLDGIRRKIDPRESGFGPFDQDVASLSDAERGGMKTLPLSLADALDALEGDHEFLEQGGAFDSATLARWIDPAAKCSTCAAALILESRL
jgi:glutamine synthetase